jgi:hypothetical protein
MAVVWAVWWFVCVRKCSRNLKALPYLSTRYRQVVPAKKAVVLLRRLVLLSSAFRSHLLLKIGCTNNKSHFDSLQLSFSFFVWLSLWLGLYMPYP